MVACASEHLRTHTSKLSSSPATSAVARSVTASDAGRSVDTSMGMTPSRGWSWATRSGDVDPALALVLGQGEGAMSPRPSPMANTR